ncbi:MAG TPA: sulfotransferase [Steroidobacteraceae bacterium]|nr:sulfotransferase [Steroidobacteraceae bacterium]
MLFKWLDTREATWVGAALADEFVVETAEGTSTAAVLRQGSPAQAQRRALEKYLRRFLDRVDREARALPLNLLKRAKLANSFKWRLLEKGVARELADDLTQTLLIRLSARADASPPEARPAARADGGSSSGLQSLLARGDASLARGEPAEAARCYRDALGLDPRNLAAGINLGAALLQLGRSEEAEAQFRRTMSIMPGRFRRDPRLQTALQVNLGTTLLLRGHWREAKALLQKALKISPHNVDALIGMGEVAGFDGRFEEAEALFRRAAEIDPSAPRAWSALVRHRRMTAADTPWLERAEKIAAMQLAPLEESRLRYAMGKFHDDLGRFDQAFEHYRRANELQRKVAERYDRKARERFVEDMLRVYTRETLARPPPGASGSERPIFVLGMPRSGTTLVAQIISSHPSARGAGELIFWSQTMQRHEEALRREPIGEPLVAELGAEYLRVLSRIWANAPRVIDKATFNSEYLGVIHRVFPRARIVYLRRDPIDTCLSCYFQEFPQQMNFAMDLSDLAHYYRTHQRLIAHWRDALPEGTMLDVPYAGLVADQRRWTRRILEFLGLEWNPRCLEFHRTERTVVTASYWQVRQELYTHSVGRWRNYEKFIGPLRELRDPEA